MQNFEINSFLMAVKLTLIAKYKLFQNKKSL